MIKKNSILKEREKRIARFHKCREGWGVKGIKSIEIFRLYPVSLN